MNELTIDGAIRNTWNCTVLAQGSTNKTDAYVSTNCLFISAVRLLETRYEATILVLVNITINSLFKYSGLVLAQYPAQPQSKGGCQKHPTCVAKGGGPLPSDFTCKIAYYFTPQNPYSRGIMLRRVEIKPRWKFTVPSTIWRTRDRATYKTQSRYQSYI